MSLGITGAHQDFTSQGTINIDLSGSTTTATELSDLTGIGETLEGLNNIDTNSGGVFARAQLDGTITYDYMPPAPPPVPEPMSITLLGTALLGLGAIGRHRGRG
jgi:hypothetical protein